MQITESLYYSIPALDDILSQPPPMQDMRAQLMDQIMDRLSSGTPVTLTYDGRKITTFYPNGTSEHHS